MPDTINNLNDLFLERVSVVRASENKLSSFLGQYDAVTNDGELKHIISHMAQAVRSRLQDIDALLGEEHIKPDIFGDDTVQGFSKELDRIVRKRGNQTDIDIGIMAILQSVNHYLLTGYSYTGNLVALDGKRSNLANFFRKSFSDLEATDKQLSELAQKKFSAAKTAVDDAEKSNANRLEGQLKEEQIRLDEIREEQQPQQQQVVDTSQQNNNPPEKKSGFIQKAQDTLSSLVDKK